MLHPTQSRKFDSKLTDMATNTQILGHVGSLAFPPVFCNTSSPNVVNFEDSERFFLHPKRTPGEQVPRYSADRGTKTKLNSIKNPVELFFDTEEEANDINTIEKKLIYLLKEKTCNELESWQLSILFDPNRYPNDSQLNLTASNQFNDSSSWIDELFNIATEKIATNCEDIANTIIFSSRQLFNIIKQHSYFDSGKNLKSIANKLGFRRYGINLGDLDNKINKIWIGSVPQEYNNSTKNNDFNLISNLDPSSGIDNQESSFGYTYLKRQTKENEKDSGIGVWRPTRSENKLSWRLNGIVECLPVITNVKAGYLFNNVIS